MNLVGATLEDDPVTAGTAADLQLFGSHLNDHAAAAFERAIDSAHRDGCVEDDFCELSGEIVGVGRGRILADDGQFCDGGQLTGLQTVGQLHHAFGIEVMLLKHDGVSASGQVLHACRVDKFQAAAHDPLCDFHQSSRVFKFVANIGVESSDGEQYGFHKGLIRP